MTTLEYYWEDGTHTIFSNYTIDENSVVKNASGHVMSQCTNEDGYNRVTLRHEGKPRAIFVHRALASTFIGPPQTLEHTTDHEDGNNSNDILSNIRWLDKTDQVKNRKVPAEYKSAFIIVKDGVELTANEWTDVYKKSNDEKYTADTIKKFAQQQRHGFRYKTFHNLRGEVWKSVQGSKNSQGEWFISSKNRMKYKTKHAENVTTVDQLTKIKGYPMVSINGKHRYCHELSMMTFRPREYAAKLPGDILLHKKDNKLDFNPFRLRWGTQPENIKDAHGNGKYDGTKTAKKPVVSYLNGILEKEHDSVSDATRYLRESGYSKATATGVLYGLNNNVIRYDRTWKNV